jgi:hypothetical protein
MILETFIIISRILPHLRTLPLFLLVFCKILSVESSQFVIVLKRIEPIAPLPLVIMLMLTLYFTLLV